MVTFDFKTVGNHPTETELTFLNPLYSRFFTIYEKFVRNEVWELPPWQRLSLIKELFSIYKECSKYPPLKISIKDETGLASFPFLTELFSTLRNILSHFPNSETWDEVQLRKSWLTLYENSSTIEKFMIRYKDVIHDFKLQMSYESKREKFSINIPDSFFKDDLVMLKEIINERQGVAFCVYIMALRLGFLLKVNNVESALIMISWYTPH